MKEIEGDCKRRAQDKEWKRWEKSVPILDILFDTPYTFTGDSVGLVSQQPLHTLPNVCYYPYLLLLELPLMPSISFSHFYFSICTFAIDSSHFDFTLLISVTVLAVKTSNIPAWDQTLAGRVRDGMTLQGTFVDIWYKLCTWDLCQTL